MFGTETITDLYGCRKVNDFIIREFAEGICKQIGMKPYGEPIIKYFAEGTDYEGYTLVQLIETSSITAHFQEKTGNIYLNIFSCRKYDSISSANYAATFFRAKNIEVRILERR